MLLLLPLPPKQQETGPGSGLTAEDLVRWVVALLGLETVCFPATGHSWQAEAGSGPANVGGPVSGRAVTVLTDSATEMATACRKRLHTVSVVAPAWWVLAMPSF